jgi:hypothetical protein
MMDAAYARSPGVGAHGIPEFVGLTLTSFPRDRLTPQDDPQVPVPAVAAGLAPSGPAMAQREWAALVMGWFPQNRTCSDRPCTCTT